MDEWSDTLCGLFRLQRSYPMVDIRYRIPAKPLQLHWCLLANVLVLCSNILLYLQDIQYTVCRPPQIVCCNHLDDSSLFLLVVSRRHTRRRLLPNLYHYIPLPHLQHIIRREIKRQAAAPHIHNLRHLFQLHFYDKVQSVGHHRHIHSVLPSFRIPCRPTAPAIDCMVGSRLMYCHCAIADLFHIQRMLVSLFKRIFFSHIVDRHL